MGRGERVPPGSPASPVRRQGRRCREGGNLGDPRLGGAPGMGLGTAGQVQSRDPRVLTGAGQACIDADAHALCPGGTKLIVLFLLFALKRPLLTSAHGELR